MSQRSRIFKNFITLEFWDRHYLELLDTAWQVKMSDDEAAMYVATLYYCGLVKNGRSDIAEPLGIRIQEIAKFCVPKGMISQERWEKFSGAISSAKYEPQKS